MQMGFDHVGSVAKGVAVMEPVLLCATSYKLFGGIYDKRQIDAVVHDVVLGYGFVQFCTGRQLQRQLVERDDIRRNARSRKRPYGHILCFTWQHDKCQLAF